MSAGKETNMNTKKTLIETLYEINPEKATVLIREAESFVLSLERCIAPFIEEVKTDELIFSTVELAEQDNKIKDAIGYIERLSNLIVWRATELREIGASNGIHSFPEGRLNITDILESLGCYEASGLVVDNLLTSLKSFIPSLQRKKRAAWHTYNGINWVERQSFMALQRTRLA